MQEIKFDEFFLDKFAGMVGLQACMDGIAAARAGCHARNWLLPFATLMPCWRGKHPAVAVKSLGAMLRAALSLERRCTEAWLPRLDITASVGRRQMLQAGVAGSLNNTDARIS